MLTTVMLHPATAHFAIVLPLVALIFGLTYLITKTETMSKVAARTTLFAAIAVIGVWYTGSKAGPEIYDYLDAAGKADLIAHKSLGLYLAIAMGIIALIQVLGCRMQKRILETVAIVLLIGATATIFYQGKMGGELVYEHGTPFKSSGIMDSLKDAAQSAEATEDDEEKIEAYEDAIDDIDSLSEEVDALYGIAPEASEDEE